METEIGIYMVLRDMVHAEMLIKQVSAGYRMAWHGNINRYPEVMSWHGACREAGETGILKSENMKIGKSENPKILTKVGSLSCGRLSLTFCSVLSLVLLSQTNI